MALSYNVVSPNVSGNRRMNLVELTVGVAGDYPAGGIALSAKSCGVDRIEGVQLVGTTPVIGVAAQWDKTNGKLKIFEGAAAAAFLGEVAGADVAGQVLTLLVIGDTSR